MKKLISVVLLLGLIISFSACGNKTVTMQQVYDAHQVKSMLDSHENVYIRHMGDGEFFIENYINKEVCYENTGTWAVYTTDNSCYYYVDGAYNRMVYIDSDGLVDLASYRANKYASPIMSPISLEEEIKSVTKKDGRITVTSVLGEENINKLAENMTSCNFEYVLDAKTLNPISSNSHHVYDDGTVFNLAAEVAYDVEMPESIKPFIELDQQTEDVRTVTIVFNPGTEKENTETVQAPKGISLGLTSVSETVDEFRTYADAACTEPYTSKDYVSDTTVYIKWIE